MDLLTFLSAAAPYLAAIISAAAGSVATILFANQRNQASSAMINHKILTGQLALTEKQQIAAEAQQEAVRVWLAAQVEDFKKRLELAEKKLAMCEGTSRRFIANQVILREKLSTLQMEFKALKRENARLLVSSVEDSNKSPD